MRIHHDLHWRELAERLHTSRSPGATQHHWSDDEAEIAKATVYISTATLVLLLVILAAIAFGQEAMHWLGV